MNRVFDAIYKQRPKTTEKMSKPLLNRRNIETVQTTDDISKWALKEYPSPAQSPKLKISRAVSFSAGSYITREENRQP